MKSFNLSLYLVLDPLLCDGIGMVETARQAVAGGVTMVQLRDKQADTATMIATGRALQDVLRPSGATLIINDDVEAAVELNAGLHVGQGDMIATVARRMIGPERILGLSVETPSLAAIIDPAVVDYAGVGPVFATPTKPDHKPHFGFDGLRTLVAACPVPAVAIGGLKLQHVEGVFQAGANGMAVVSAICGMLDPYRAASDLSQAIAGVSR